MFPTPHTVEHVSRVRSGLVGTNALGQIGYQAVHRTRAVYGWSTKSTTSGTEGDLAERVTTELSLLTPDSDWHNGDTVTLPNGEVFTVRGGVEDMNTGPFGFTPGYRVKLRMVQDGIAE